MSLSKKVLGTFVIASCLLGSFSNQTFAFNDNYDLKYKKNDSIVHQLSNKNNHFSAFVYCKADRNQKFYIQVLKKGKWLQYYNSKGEIKCHKSKPKRFVFGDTMRKKGDKVRIYFVNPGKSNVHLKVKIEENYL